MTGETDYIMQRNGNKAEIYLRERKEYIHDKIMLLNAKLNKNSMEIEQLDEKIKEINQSVDIAMEVFSPHKKINDFTREEIASLTKKKKDMIGTNEELRTQIQELSKEEEQLKSAIQDMEEIVEAMNQASIHTESTMGTEDSTNNIESKYDIRTESAMSAEGLQTKWDMEYSSKMSILQTQEMERKRIARELQNSPLQVLTNCIHKVELCNKVMDMDPVRAKLELEILGSTINNAIHKIREIIFDLSPMDFDNLGIETSLEKIINQIKVNAQVNIEIQYTGEKKEISPVVGLTIIRLIQEACNNSLKHAKGKNINVSFMYEEHQIRLEIMNDGIGFVTGRSVNEQSSFTQQVCAVSSTNTGTLAARKGDSQHEYKKEESELSIMRERVYLLSGEISVHTDEQHNTTIIMEIPLDGGSFNQPELDFC